MKIIRDGVEITLTDKEVSDAYKEHDHKLKLEMAEMFLEKELDVIGDNLEKHYDFTEEQAFDPKFGLLDEIVSEFELIEENDTPYTKQWKSAVSVVLYQHCTFDPYAHLYAS